MPSAPRLTFTDGTPDILAYPKDRPAYGRLCRLLTTGNGRAEKGDCILTIDDLNQFSEGLRLIVVPPRRLLPAFSAQVRKLAADLSDQLWLGITMPRLGDDRRRLAAFAALAKSTGLKPIALGDPLYHTPERRPLQDIVTCIREHVTIDEAGFRLEQNAERHLKRPEEMERLFADLPEA